MSSPRRSSSAGRRWLTALYIGRWLDAGAHYHMALAGSPADNPDQRIADDIFGFIYGGGAGLYGYSVIALQTVTALVSYSIVLWDCSANFTVPGTSSLRAGLPVLRRRCSTPASARRSRIGSGGPW